MSVLCGRMDPTAVKALIDAELAAIADARVTDFIRRLLVEPTVSDRLWDFADAWEDVRLPCWTVLDDPVSRSGVAYCAAGGPPGPWGLVATHGTGSDSMGAYTSWFPTLAEAFANSVAATRLPIWRIYAASGGQPRALSEEMSWAEAWEQFEAVTLGDPETTYLLSPAFALPAGDQ